MHSISGQSQIIWFPIHTICLEELKFDEEFSERNAHRLAQCMQQHEL